MRWRLVVVDVIVAALAFAVSAAVLASADRSAGLRPPDLVGYVLLAAYSGTVVLRRPWPVVAVAGAIAAGVAYSAADYPLALTPAAVLPVYTAATVLPQPQARRLLAAVVVVGMLGATAAPGPTDLGVPALLAAAWCLGSYVGSRRAYTAELESKNRLLEQMQVELAHRAVTDERLRIARELHDVVTHTMSVVAVHAGSGRMVAASDPEAARDALATIETATRSALSEMRQLLGVLRGSDSPDATASFAPAPGLVDLHTLVADIERSGVQVTTQIDGDRAAVPPAVDLSAYRIAQEALTNVLKHAGPGAHAIVRIGYGPEAVTVEVLDDGAVVESSAPPGSGHGIVGMRERVALFDGDLDAARRPEGGFRVSARLPFGGRS